MHEKLRLPAALAVLVLAGCDDGAPPEMDAATADAGNDAAVVADAGADAGPCEFPEIYNPDTMMCEGPVV